MYNIHTFPHEIQVRAVYRKVALFPVWNIIHCHLYKEELTHSAILYFISNLIFNGVIKYFPNIICRKNATFFRHDKKKQPKRTLQQLRTAMVSKPYI